MNNGGKRALRERGGCAVAAGAPDGACGASKKGILVNFGPVIESETAFTLLFYFNFCFFFGVNVSLSVGV